MMESTSDENKDTILNNTIEKIILSKCLFIYFVSYYFFYSYRYDYFIFRKEWNSMVKY